MKNYPVKVLGNEQGVVVILNPNKEGYASIGFEQIAFVDRGGYLSKKRRVAYLNGTVADLTEFAKEMKLTQGKELPGKLVVTERYTPFWTGQEPKINPQDGRVVLMDGAQVYMETSWDLTDTKNDSFITGEMTQGNVLKDPTTITRTSLLSSSVTGTN